MSKKEEHNKGTGVELPTSPNDTSVKADNSSPDAQDAHPHHHVEPSSASDATTGEKSEPAISSASSVAASEAAASKDADSLKKDADSIKENSSADKPASSLNTSSAASYKGTAFSASAGSSAAKASSGGADKHDGGPQKPLKKRGGTPQWLLVLLAVLLLLILVALGWDLQRINTQHDRIDELTQQVNSLHGEGQQRFQQALSDSRRANESLGQRLDENEEAVQHVLDEMNRHQQTDAREWSYAEVEYLLRIANQRLALERDINGAQQLLHTADERLAETGNPAFIPVRRAISNELGELESVPNVDREGIYLQLASAQQQFDKLPLAQDTEALKAEAESSDEFSGGWRQQLGRLGDQLKDLVTVRHHDQPLEALITPQQEGYLRENVRLQLEQAQLALLRQDPQIFKSALDQAATLVDKYYRSDDSGVQHALQHLQELSELQVRPDIPDISGSLERLRDILSRRSSAADAEQGE